MIRDNRKPGFLKSSSVFNAMEFRDYLAVFFHDFQRNGTPSNLAPSRNKSSSEYMLRFGLS